MSVAPRLDLRQSQSLTMTPRLQQAIGLLQMNVQELEAVVTQELEKNPFLEKEGDSVIEYETSDVDTQKTPEIEDYPLDTNDIPTEDSFYEQVTESDDFSDSSFDFSMDAWSGSGAGGEMESSFMPTDLCATPKASLYESLASQINMTIKDNGQINLAYRLISALDDRGFLSEDITPFCPMESLETILPVLQGFSPTGIFARNIQECFALQLKEKNRFDPAIAVMLDNLELVAKREYKKLSVLCGVDIDDIMDMIADIKQLSPNPVADYEQEPASALIPDVLLRQNKYGDFTVELNQAVLPKVLINRTYAAEIASFAEKDKESKKFLNQNLSSASWLIKALNQRAETILKVATEIVDRQKEFFKKGEAFLKPMVLKDVAESIGMHESTVSRVTARKYIATSRGVFELKYFFSQALETNSGGESVSSHSVKLRIKQLIESEKPEKILSDESLVSILRQEGVDIARRTVAKYRESIGIATSAMRKREKRPLN